MIQLSPSFPELKINWKLDCCSFGFKIMWVIPSGQLLIKKIKKDYVGCDCFYFHSFSRQHVERRERKSLTGLKASNFLLIAFLFSRLLAVAKKLAGDEEDLL